MADWQTISALVSAGGTLVLAVATFGAIRSANRSARVAERAFLANMRPLLMQSLFSDPPLKAFWSDQHAAKVDPGRAVVEHVDDVIYMAFGLRNAGSGIALVHGWYLWPAFERGDPAAAEQFRRQGIDIYVPPDGVGLWESALRDPDEEIFHQMATTVAARETFVMDILYGDQEGGQRSISRFVVRPYGDDAWYTQSGRHWNVDRPAPR